MNHIRYQKLLRMGKRGMDIIQAQNLHPAIEAVAPALSAVFLDFGTSMEDLRRAADDTKASVLENYQVVDRLCQEYDVARSAVMAWGTSEDVGKSGRNYSVLEDLLLASYNLVSVLGNHAQADWAQKMSARLTQVLQKAQESCDKTKEARLNLQKLQATNRENAGKLQHTLVTLRLVLRAVYGRSSLEYQMLRVSKIQQEDTPKSAQDTVVPTSLTQIPNKNAA